MASIEVLLPRTSDAMTEAHLDQWVVETGQTVREGDVIAEVETEKAMVDVTATADGTLVHEVPGGTTVGVGTTICRILTGADADAFDPTTHGLLASGPVPPSVSIATGSQPEVPPTVATAPQPEVPPTVATAPQPTVGIGRPAISPLARKMAREAGIDSATLAPGSGPGGRVLRADVERAIAKARVSVGTSSPLSLRHATIARRMVESKQTIPHFYLNRRVEVDRLTDLHERLAGSDPRRKVMFTAWLIRAAWLALKVRPELAVRWTDSGIQQVDEPGVGFAVALDGVDLAVPVVRGEHLATATSTSLRMTELIATARQGRLSLADSEGATATVSNLGAYGVDQLYPILPVGQPLILGVGRAGQELCLGPDGQVQIRHVINLSLSADHRLVSGAMGAAYLAEIAQLLEEPLRLVS
jgi:pyruvate dehydrogenase E2 component (dihydrolipoamide acetyltransferase)